jgi:drug/metabolite transporter (DMT)-like permease
MGVSQAIAAFYVYPAITYGLGIWVLGESHSTAKWTAIGIGFVGVLIAVGPGLDATPAGIAFAVLAAGLASMRVVMYREDAHQTPPTISTLWDRSVGAALLTLAVMFTWEPIPNSAFLAVFGLITSSIVAQLLFVYAVARGSLGVLAPFAFWEVAGGFRREAQRDQANLI